MDALSVKGALERNRQCCQFQLKRVGNRCREFAADSIACRLVELAHVLLPQAPADGVGYVQTGQKRRTT